VAALLRLCGYHGLIEIRPRHTAPSSAPDNQPDLPLDATEDDGPMPAWWMDARERPRVVPMAGQMEMGL